MASFLLSLALIAGILVASLLLTIYSGATGPLPSYAELADLKNPVASEVYSSDSVLLGRFFLQERSDVPFEDIPEHTVDALVATEDARFYQHDGIDTKSLFRVAIKSILLGNESSGGGSTISQQLAKNLYPRRNYLLLSTPINKVREMVVARRLEKSYSKSEILGLYLNTVPFGENIFGIDAAAQRFFSVPARQLKAEQSAVLIGMLKATYTFNPRVFPEKSKTRRDVVLSLMLKNGKITEAEFSRLSRLPITLKYNRITHHEGPAPYFREQLRSEMLEWCRQYNNEHAEDINLYTSGLKIYTTIDSRMQHYAEAAMMSQMATTQSRFASQVKSNDPLKSQEALVVSTVKGTPRYSQLADDGLSETEALSEMKKPVRMSLFGYKKNIDTLMSPFDSVKYYLRFLNAGILAMEPGTGAIRVWVGGVNHEHFQFDHVRESTKRQVGSTFKPIVYAAAIEAGVRPCSFTTSEKTVYNNVDDWAPRNADENYDMKFSMPGALAMSVNTVSVRMLEKAGIDRTISLARDMGINSRLQAVPSLALGTPDISVMEMVTAYSTFVSGGQSVKPHYLTSIANHEGTVLETLATAESHRAMSEETALLMLHMLRRTVNEGTGASLRTKFGLTNDMAGKTGTTQSNTDGWFMAMTPKLVIGAWVGADNPVIRFSTTAQGQGARTALPIVGEFFQLMRKDHSLDSINHARFPQLSSGLASKINCEFYKEDKNLLRRLSGRKEKKKNFGEPRKGFLRKLFSKD